MLHPSIQKEIHNYGVNGVVLGRQLSEGRNIITSAADA